MPGPSILTIGHFDGVHLGHRALLARARALAGPARARVVAMAFDPSPLSVLRPAQEPARLTSLETKARRLRAAGADEVRILTPTPELLAVPAEAFVEQLVADFAPAAFVEGPDFRFGNDRRGDAALLRQLGERHGFGVEIVPPAHAALADQCLVPVRSSLVRWLLRQGRVLDAATCLGQPFELTSEVVEGEKRGRTIGVPTINFDVDALAGWVIPADAVYAGHATLPDGKVVPAAISIGVKPTFRGRGGTRVIEAHLPGFSGDLYGRRITLAFTRWLRDQWAFPGVDALRAQLARDIQQARAGSELALPAWSARSMLAAASTNLSAPASNGQL